MQCAGYSGGKQFQAAIQTVVSEKGQCKPIQNLQITVLHIGTGKRCAGGIGCCQRPRIMLSTSGDFMSMAWAARHNKKPHKNCRATKIIDLQRPPRQLNLGYKAHKGRAFFRMRTVTGHIGNTSSVSASAYQGTAFTHPSRRPIRALGCGRAAMVLLKQNRNDKYSPVGLRG